MLYLPTGSLDRYSHSQPVCGLDSNHHPNRRKFVNTMSKLSPLRQLIDIMSQSVDKIEAEMERVNLSYPSLDEPSNPFSPEEAASMSPAVRQSAALITSACAQLSAIVDVPTLTLYYAAGGFHLSSCIRVAVEGNFVEILSEKPAGMHVDDIAAKNGGDPSRLARVLRFLATHHIFKEVDVNVFANNRLSSMMDTGKTVEEINADPINKHTNALGIAALLEHTADEVMKASTYLPEVLSDPATKLSGAPQHTPFALGLKTEKPIFEWLEEPTNEYRLKRFAAAMEGVSRGEPTNAVLKTGFKWGDLSPNAVIVDVGGGKGHVSLEIAQQHSHLRFVIQDRPRVIEEAKGFWEQKMPSALQDGTVTLQAHDFFTPQPKLDVAVFLCRMILHDFPQDKATVILKNLRAASGPQTKLLFFEELVPYACRESSPSSKLSAKAHIEPPEPLLANMGRCNAVHYYADLQMFVCGFGEERTVGRFEELLESAGWKLVDVNSIPGSVRAQFLAVPV